MLIPVYIWLFLLAIAFGLMTIINSFIVLFTGHYWKSAYEISVYFIRMNLKISFFFYGLTNTYPGFSSQTTDFTVEIPYPKNPNRAFAFPIVGGIARGILLIPYYIYSSVIQNAGNIGALAASFVVLFRGTYPESFYEIARDGIRTGMAASMYTIGLSDEYPSWWISMHHKTTKIILIVFSVLFILFRVSGNFHRQFPQQQPSYTPPPSVQTY